MFHVCPECGKILEVPAEKIPAQRARYTCKECGAAAVFQDHLHANREAAERHAAPVQPEGCLDGTVYHNVSHLSRQDMPAAVYELVCAVKGADGGVRKLTFREQRITIGRRGADLEVDDPLVSRRHAELERVQERVILKDLGSTNGTFLNEQQITAEFVEKGDTVRVGNALIKVAVQVR